MEQCLPLNTIFSRKEAPVKNHHKKKQTLLVTVSQTPPLNVKYLATEGVKGL